MGSGQGGNAQRKTDRQSGVVAPDKFEIVQSSQKAGKTKSGGHNKITSLWKGKGESTRKKGLGGGSKKTKDKKKPVHTVKRRTKEGKDVFVGLFLRNKKGGKGASHKGRAGWEEKS